MKSLVLAAGKSERLRKVLGDLPKPMTKVCGKPLLNYNLELLKKYGINDVYINLHYQPEAITDYFENGSDFGLKIFYSYEKYILGTAGAVKKIQKNFTERFIVLYGDNITDIDLNAMLTSHENSKCIATIAMFDKNVSPNTAIAGGKIITDESGNVLKFIEGSSPEAKKYNFINCGIYILEPEIMNFIPDNSFYDFGKDVFPLLINKGISLNTFLIDGYCLGADTPEALSKAEDIIKNCGGWS